MRCDECNEPHAKKYFVNWLCKKHGFELEMSLGLRPAILTSPCECNCHVKTPKHWCDSCWNNKDHPLQIAPLMVGATKQDGSKLTQEELDKRKKSKPYQVTVLAGGKSNA